MTASSSDIRSMRRVVEALCEWLQRSGPEVMVCWRAYSSSHAQYETPHMPALSLYLSIYQLPGVPCSGALADSCPVSCSLATSRCVCLLPVLIRSLGFLLPSCRTSDEARMHSRLLLVSLGLAMQDRFEQRACIISLPCCTLASVDQKVKSLSTDVR